MSEIRARLATGSDPRATDRWVLSPEAIDSMVEQLPGKPVTIENDRNREVGRVLSATKDEIGIQVTMVLSSRGRTDLRGWTAK